MVTFFVFGNLRYVAFEQVVDRKRLQVSHLVLSAEGGSKGPSPNMIGEQILELRDGLSTFQATAFETLYDKKVGWVKGDKEVDASPVSVDKVEEVANTEVVVGDPVASAPVESAPVAAVPVAAAAVAKAPVSEAASVKEVNLVLQKSMANVAVMPIAVVDPEVKKEFIAVRDIPIRPKPEIDDELAAEMKKKAIMKAQQAVTQSFLSLEAAPPAAPSGGGFFGFLKSDDAVQKIANDKPSAPPSMAKAFRAPVSAEPVPQNEVKKSAISRPTISDLKAEASEASEEAPPGGFFGFLKQGSPEVKPVSVPAPAPARVEPVAVKVAAETAEKKPAGGFFSFLNSDPNIQVAASKPTNANLLNAVTVPAPIRVEKKEKEISKPIEKVSAPILSGGMFGFLKSTPAPEVPKKQVQDPVVQKPVVVVAAAPVKQSSPAPKGGLFSFLTPTQSTTAVLEEVVAPAVAKKVAVVDAKKKVAVSAPTPVAIVTPAPVAAPAPSGGLFGFLGNKGKDSAPAKASTSSPAVGMNVKFQAAVSKLLKGDTVKIKTFQRATDRLRSDDISGDEFLLTLETLFGAEDLESVVIPLISELPERKTADTLQAAYDKKVAAIAKASAPPKGPFSFSFLTPPQKKPAAPVAAAVVLPIAEKKKMPVAASRLKSLTPAPVAATKAVVFKVPSKVPIGKKVSIEKQMKSLLAGTTDPKSFYTSISRELGKEKMAEVIGDIISVFPADIGSKLDGFYRADK
jgi:hypothetical protein